MYVIHWLAEPTATRGIPAVAFVSAGKSFFVSIVFMDVCGSSYPYIEVPRHSPRRCLVVLALRSASAMPCRGCAGMHQWT